MGRNVKSRGFPNRATLETRNIWVATGHSVDNRVVGVILSKNESAAFAMRGGQESSTPSAPPTTPTFQQITVTTATDLIFPSGQYMARNNSIGW